MEQIKNLKKRSLIILTFSVLISFLFVSLITYGATTIGSNINTDGTLIVQGRINASSTFQATGAARFYSTARIDGATILNSVSYTWPSSDGSASTYLQTNGAGTLSWATVSSGSSADWLKQTNFGVLNLTASTTIPYWAKDAIYASSTLQVQGLATLTNATTSLLTVSNGAWFTNGNIGISTTSPWGLLSINPNGISGPSFVVGSSTATNFVITNSGNVGIGTTSPGSLFSLNNIANFTTATSSFYGNGINLANGCFALNGTCVGAGGSGTINSGTTGQLSYYAGSGTTLTATSSLFIHSNQNIGIGTTTPNWLLQVAGTRPFFTLSDTGAGANNKHWFLSSQGGNFYVGTSSDAYATSTVSKLTILSNGNVGIGTTTPQAQFAIQGNAYFEGNIGVGTAAPRGLLNIRGYTGGADASAVAAFNENLVIGGTFNQTYNSGNAVLLHISDYSNDEGDNVYPIYVEDENNNVAFYLNSGASGSTGTAYFNGKVGIGTTTPWGLLSVEQGSGSPVFVVSDQGTSTPHLLVDGTGKVGIGTTTPAEQLSVSGRLFVGGTGTSTIQNNLYVMGTLRSTVSYVGDLIFSNNFKFIETNQNEKIQSLFLQNQYGEDIFKINEKGQIVVKEIEAERGRFRDELETKNIKIGSPQNRTGITIYDKDTGKPYCIEMRKGQVVSKENECK